MRTRIKYEFLRFLLPASVLLGGIIAYYYFSEIAKRETVLLANETSSVSLGKLAIAQGLEPAITDLMVLAQHDQFSILSKPAALGRLAADFLVVAREKRLYDQIRFLDETGMEIIRINYNAGHPRIVPKDRLQNKGNRYYFKNTMSLGKAEIFVSPLDLNIENGEIEQPIKPIVRLGTPVFDGKGRKRGVVLLNYFGSILIRKFEQAVTNIADHAMILNADGFWLRNPRPGLEWGFMLGHGQSMREQFPNAWQRISKAEQGQFVDADGLFTFATVYPLLEARTWNSGTMIADGRDGSRDEDKGYNWKIVAWLPPEALGAAADGFAVKLSSFTALLFGLLAVGSWKMASARIRRQEAEKALRKSERDIRAVFERMQDAFYRADLEGRLVMISPSMSNLLGYAPEELLGERLAKIYTDPKEQEKLLNKLSEKGGSLDNHEVLLRRKDGVEVWASINAHFYRDDQGNVAGVEGAAHDITIRKQAEKALRRAKEKADSASRAKSEFLSRMSHDLRTPLNAILGFSQLLGYDSNAPLNAEQEEYIQYIRTAGNHLLNLIDEVLDLATIEAGKVKLFIETVAPQQIFDECISLTQALADKRNIRLIRRYRDGALPAVCADRARLKEVLLNLLSNAIKYNREGGRVTIECRQTTMDMLHVSVADTGPGIPADKQGELFQTFNRLGAENTETEGTGIGLAITKRLVELMNGHIGCDSALGQGTTFWLELPLAGEPATEEVTDKVAQTSEQGPVTPTPMETRTLLYVEDNPANQRLMASIIDRLPGTTLLSAYDAKEGLELAAACTPDVIIMDINLPGMNGIEALASLRKSAKTRDIPAIALSAQAMPKDVEMGHKVGFQAYLTKPIDIDKILQTITDTLQNRR